MTIEEIIAVLEAYRRGKEIEYLYDVNKWEPCPKPVWNFHLNTYRIKPEPHKPKYWSKEEHIPVGALVRTISEPKAVYIILSNVEGFVSIRDMFGRAYVDFNSLKDYEHSTDNGKTWHPCTVQTAA